MEREGYPRERRYGAEGGRRLQSGGERADPARRRTAEPRQASGGRRRRRKKRGPLFIVKSLFLVGLFTGLMFTGIFALYVGTCIIPNAHVDVSELSVSHTSIVYYQNSAGQWTELETLHGGTNSIWSDYETLPPYLEKAAVAIEDKRFYTHRGVDWPRTVKAVLNLFTHSESTFGGSTLTQQTIKNVTGEKEGTVKRKVMEIFRALDFERTHSKEDIIELYLNNIYLGHGCVGVNTAAKTYFGKDVSELTLAECADLIGITNNPSLYDPYGSEDARRRNLERKDTILDEMYKQGYIASETQYREAKAQELVFTRGDQNENDSEFYSWFVDQLINDIIADLQKEKGYSKKVAEQMVYYGGLNIYATQDLDVQKAVDEVYTDRSNLAHSSKGYDMQSAITILDPYTGDIVAMAGGMGEKEGSRVFNRASARRQCGSAIKPIAVYAPALDNGTITPASIIDDAPVRMLGRRAWPVNSHAYFEGLVTVDHAIAQSLNTCAVRVVEMLGVEESFRYMTEKLGFTTLISAHDNPSRNDVNSASMGLGGLTRGVNTIEMAAAYATFPNKGVYNKPRTYIQVTDRDGKIILDNTAESRVVMKETTAYFMNQYLRKVVTGGTGGSAAFSGMTIAGKTGTTTDNFDRYFVGYTPYYVAAVWTGYDVNIKINASGNPSAVLFRKVMSKVHANLPSRNFPTVEGGLVRVSTCLDCGKLATAQCSADARGSRVQSVYVASGTAPTESCTCHVGIRWCTEGNAAASAYCPDSCVTTRTVVDYVRSGAAASVGCRDAAYLKNAAALGSNQCKVHTESYVPPEEGEDPNHPTDPNDPNAPNDPTDPNDPPDPNDPTGQDPGEPTDPNGGTQEPSDPNVTEPSDPEEPRTQESSDTNDPNGGMFIHPRQ